jgi:MFS family permease
MTVQGIRSGATAGLRAFRHRNYRLFFGGQVISLVGTWMQQVAQAWLVLQLTRDPLWLGIITAAQFVPVLLFGLFAGVLADALPKRRTLIAVQTVMMTLAVVLGALVVTNVVQVWMILLIALLLGVANAVDMPVRQAFAVEMVGREDLANAVALNSAMFNAARIVGPAIAGVVIAVVGVAAAILLNGLSFLAVIGGLFLMRDQELHAPAVAVARPTTPRAVVASLREGVAYVLATPVVLLAVIAVGLVSTFALNFQVLIPAYAQFVLGVGADGFGFLMAAGGVGSLIAALWLAFGGGARLTLLGAGAVLLGLAEVGLGVTATFPLALGLMLFAGAGGVTMAVTANTLIQARVPDHLRGRVIAVYTTVFVGATPLGGLVVGVIASTAGSAMAILLSGASAVVIGAVALAWVRRREEAPGGGSVPEAVGGSALASIRRR